MISHNLRLAMCLENLFVCKVTAILLLVLIEDTILYHCIGDYNPMICDVIFSRFECCNAISNENIENFCHSLFINTAFTTLPFCTKYYINFFHCKHLTNSHLDGIEEFYQLGDGRLLYLLARDMEPLALQLFINELRELKNSRSTLQKAMK